jgi:hypothetical protein
MIKRTHRKRTNKEIRANRPNWTKKTGKWVKIKNDN